MARATDLDASNILFGVREFSSELLVIIGFSILGYFIALAAIPRAMQLLVEKGIYGIDINKNTMEDRKRFGQLRRTGGPEAEAEIKKKAIPESLGIIVGPICLSIIVIVLVATNGVISLTEHESMSLAKANAAINTISVMLLLGFVDDVLDVRWRYKILLSSVGAIPLILTYDGSVSVAIPPLLRGYFSESYFYLGPLYLLYIALVCIFCTNGINILAGVNGVEVGQSIIIAIASIIHNCIQMRLGVSTASQHLLALLLLIPFVAVSFALWKFNKYPSKVFIGDSYTYFAGMVIAVAAISGVYTKTLLLFLVPQLINFLLSLPQLFGIVPCPRHRVPTWDPGTNLLSNSHNYTLLNAILFFTGPMSERNLTRVTLFFQVICCIFAFFVRYYLAGLFFDVVV